MTIHIDKNRKQHEVWCWVEVGVVLRESNENLFDFILNNTILDEMTIKSGQMNGTSLSKYYFVMKSFDITYSMITYIFNCNVMQFVFVYSKSQIIFHSNQILYLKTSTLLPWDLDLPALNLWQFLLLNFDLFYTKICSYTWLTFCISKLNFFYPKTLSFFPDKEDRWINIIIIIIIIIIKVNFFMELTDRWNGQDQVKWMMKYYQWRYYEMKYYEMKYYEMKYYEEWRMKNKYYLQFNSKDYQIKSNLNSY